MKEQFRDGLQNISKKELKYYDSEPKPRITDKDREIILSVLFNDLHLFDYLRNTWSLRSLAEYLTNELGITISFKHLQQKKDQNLHWWKRLIFIWDSDTDHVIQMVLNYINAEKEDWLTIIHLTKKAPYPNPNEKN